MGRLDAVLGVWLSTVVTTRSAYADITLEYGVDRQSNIQLGEFRRNSRAIPSAGVRPIDRG